jgi:hypothetical protein
MGNPRCFCTMYKVCMNEQIRICKHPSAIGRGLVAGYKSADIARARSALACTQKPSRATWSIPPSQNGPCVLLGTVMSVYSPMDAARACSRPRTVNPSEINPTPEMFLHYYVLIISPSAYLRSTSGDPAVRPHLSSSERQASAT